MKYLPLLSGAVLPLLLSPMANAHFQMIHADDYLRDKGGKVVLNMPFTLSLIHI